MNVLPQDKQLRCKQKFPLVGDTFVRILTILLIVLAGPALAVGTGDRATFARLAYARSPDFLTTLDAASTKPSHRLRAESSSGPRLRVLTVAAAGHLAGCAATLHSTEPAASVQRAQLLAAKFIPADELAIRGESRRSTELETFPSSELAALTGTAEAVEPTTPLELAARGETIEVIGAEMPPSTELATRETSLQMMDAATPPPIEITARDETVAVAEADTRAVEELELFSPAETMSREDPTPERVVAVPAPAQVVARPASARASSHQKSPHAKSPRKSASRMVKRHRRVAQRRLAKVRRPEPPVVIATYTDTYTDPRRGRIPRSAEKMYDANWQDSAFTYQ